MDSPLFKYDHGMVRNSKMDPTKVSDDSPTTEKRRTITSTAHARRPATTTTTPTTTTADDERLVARPAGSRQKQTDEGDERWQEPQRRWGRLVTDACEDLGLTLGELADQISSAGEFPREESLKNWVNNRSRVRWEWLSEIGRVLQIPMIVQLTELDLIDNDSFLHTAELLERERAENQKLLAEMIKRTQGNLPSGRLTQAVLATEKLDVRFRPWMEGMKPFTTRAGDFMMISALDGSAMSLDDVEHLVGKELKAEGCWKIERPANQPPEWQNDTGSSDDVPLVWYVPGLNAIKPPSAVPAAIPFSSIMVFGAHVSTWGTDVASLVGGALGWGSCSTTTLTRVVYGAKIADAGNKKWRIQARGRVAAEALREPDGRAAQMVFSHSEAGAVGPLIDHIKKGKQDPLVVFLRPTARLLDYISTKDRTFVPRSELEALSQRIEDALVDSTTPHLIIDVGFPDDTDPSSPLTQELRDRKLSRSMIVSALILNYLFEGKIEDCQPSESCPEPFARFVNSCSSLPDGSLMVPEFEPPVSFE